MRDITVGNSSTDHTATGTAQDRELLLLDGENIAHLRGQVAYLAERTGRLAPAEFGALAATLQRGLAGRPVRAAVVAASPEQASGRFAGLLAMLDDGARAAMDLTGGVFLGEGSGLPSIGYLFPGQGSGKGDDGGALARRFETVCDLYRTVTLPACDDPTAPSWRSRASPCPRLRACGCCRCLEASEGGGAMAGIGAGPDEVEPLLRGEPVVIAGYNGPAQTGISGPAEAVERVREAAAANGLRAARVPVSHAFHSPAVAPAAAKLDSYLAGRQFQPLARRVLSTLTGDVLPADADLRQLLVRQVREPVRFSQALSRMAPEVDLLIEVGPGRVLSGLAARITPDTPVIPLNTDGPSLSGLLSAVAAAYVLGMTVRHDRLMVGRLMTTLQLNEDSWSGWPARSARLVGDRASRPR